MGGGWRALGTVGEVRKYGFIGEARTGKGRQGIVIKAARDTDISDGRESPLYLPAMHRLRTPPLYAFIVFSNVSEHLAGEGLSRETG